MSTGRILIVDDEASLLLVMEKYLKRLGYAVDACRTGEDAWRLYETEPSSYALVLADIVLPKMSGEELLRRMLQLNPELRVLICSGYPYDAASLEAPTEEQVGSLQKPFSPKMLAEAVDRLLGPPAPRE